jgi:hypothetical protein
MRVRVSVEMRNDVAVDVAEKAKAAGNDNINGDHNISSGQLVALLMQRRPANLTRTSLPWPYQ